MSRRPSSIVLLLLVLAGVAIAMWVISTRSRPALAVYDSMPAAPARSDPIVAGGSTQATPIAAPGAGVVTREVSTATPARHSSDSAARRPPHTALPRRDTTPAGADTARPHRSDNYGGYSGYGSKERRGDPHAR